MDAKDNFFSSKLLSLAFCQSLRCSWPLYLIVIHCVVWGFLFCVEMGPLHYLKTLVRSSCLSLSSSPEVIPLPVLQCGVNSRVHYELAASLWKRLCLYGCAYVSVVATSQFPLR